MNTEEELAVMILKAFRLALISLDHFEAAKNNSKSVKLDLKQEIYSFITAIITWFKVAGLINKGFRGSLKLLEMRRFQSLDKRHCLFNFFLSSILNLFLKFISSFLILVCSSYI